MNRLEAIARCKELGIHRDLSEKEIQTLDSDSEKVWLRSRTFLACDELPSELKARTLSVSAKLRKARELASEYAS